MLFSVCNTAMTIINPFRWLVSLLDYQSGVVPSEDRLRQTLRGWQIFCIAITAIVGSGIFINYPRAAATAGPAGLLIAISVVGLLAIAVMDGLSEMVQLFPTMNPIVEFVDLFVDPALANCVAASYWFSYSSFLAVQLATAASYVKPENDDDGKAKLIRAACFFVIAPVAMIILNLRRVNVFGWIETFCGAVKVFLVFVVSGILLYIAGYVGGANNLTKGIMGSNPFQAISLVTERVAFSFLGIESVAIMTFEAKDIVDVKVPSQIIAWVTLLIYMVYAITLSMCFNWTNLGLTIPSFMVQLPGQEPALMIAADKITDPNSGLHYALKVILIFCALSCANTSLFIASRTLYGSAKYSEYVTSVLVSPFASATKKGVPKWAVILSGVFWSVWLPFVSLSDSTVAKEVIAFFSTSGSICVLFVWGALCLAYLRYWGWFFIFKKDLPGHPILSKYNRWNKKARPFGTMLWWLQPGVAIFGLIGSWTLVFIFPSALWWYDNNLTVASFFQKYLSPVFIIGGWMLLKAYEVLIMWRSRPLRDIMFVSQPSDDMDKLLEVVENLTKYLKKSQTVPKRADTEMVRNGSQASRQQPSDDTSPTSSHNYNQQEPANADNSTEATPQ